MGWYRCGSCGQRREHAFKPILLVCACGACKWRNAKAPARDWVEPACNMLRHLGFVEDGATREEVVRVSTASSPVLGKGGGELATFGGRKRFRRGDIYATVGKRTVCIYRRPEGGEPTGFTNFRTRDLDLVKKHLEEIDG